MTATSAPPRPELIDRRIAADLVVLRPLERLRVIRRRLDRPGARPVMASAYLGGVEGRYEQASGELRADRHDARAPVPGRSPGRKEALHS